MNTLNTLKVKKTAKRAFPPIRVDLMDRLLDTADKMKNHDATPMPSRWKRQ